MKVSDFDYELPEELIAQDPLKDRSSSRLLVLDRVSGDYTHRHFSDIVSFLREGDCLVINNTRVLPARLYGAREETGGKVELLLLERKEKDVWEVLVRPGKKCRQGSRLTFGDGRLKAEVLAVVEDGNRLVRFDYRGIFEEVLDALGEMPLPPYITHRLQDRERYQTVYAREEGSAAAPTAGLHFTPELLDEIRGMGVSVAELTLHVGLGTFRPVKAEEVTDHIMHEERYEVSRGAADTINGARAAGGRIIACGTTSVRTLETVAAEDGTMRPAKGRTDIFIYPGYRFKAVDALITNFHLPKSTLLMLVSAFAGRDHVLAAYEEAVRERYRFFSFGDAMFIR